MKENTVTTFAKLFVGGMLALILLLAAFGVGVGVGMGQARTQTASAVPSTAVELAVQEESPTVMSSRPLPQGTPSPAERTPTAQMTASPTPPRAMLPTPTRQDKSALPDDAPLDTALLNEAWKLLKEQFYGNLPEGEEVTYAAVRGIVDSLGDKHTAFLDPQQAEAFNIDVQGQFEGIGARVDVAMGGGVQIKHLFADQPAQKAGLQVDDIIIEVDGTDVTSMQLDAAVSLIRGPRGTQVRLKVIRNGAAPFDIIVTRARIEIPVITTQTLANGTVEYIALSEFSSLAPERVQEAVRAAVGRKPKGIVLDLRDNPGGLLDASVRIGSYFVPEGNILIERFADGRQQEYKRQGRYLLSDIPLAVLVNGGSASASEIVAGAIQDAGVGVLIGTQTYGKGSVQLPNSLSDGSQLRVTIARWYTPKDRGIDETGLTPDIESPDPTAEQVQADVDPQLERAVEYLLTSK